jgi:hypothetical protein
MSPSEAIQQKAVLTHIAAPSPKIKKKRQISKKFSPKISYFCGKKTVNVLFPILGFFKKWFVVFRGGDNQVFMFYICAMYFRYSLRHNPAKDRSDGYYRLIKSCRNETDRVCYRTLLSVDFIRDLVDIDQLNQIRRILCNRYFDVQSLDFDY